MSWHETMKPPMTLNEYQAQARATAMYPNPIEDNAFVTADGRPTQVELGLIYCALKLAGESGEVAEKVGKLIRDKNGRLTEEDARLLAKELGDVLWYIANLARELGLQLGTVAQMNLDKLASRKERGVLTGSGDER